MSIKISSDSFKNTSFVIKDTMKFLKAPLNKLC